MAFDFWSFAIPAIFAGAVAIYTRLSKGETRDAVTETKLQEYVDKIQRLDTRIETNCNILQELRLETSTIKSKVEEQGRLLYKSEETLQRTCALYDTVHNAHAEILTVIAVEKIKTLQLEGQITRIWKRLDNQSI